QFTHRVDQIGLLKGFDNKWYLTLFIESGRLIYKPNAPLKTGVAEIAKVHHGDFRLTANQYLIVAGVPEAQKEQIE
ncbi:sulfite reductase subunit beta, partial [Proteus mirabilis]|nr:sulfite reductase subunit beta [Proteus mirabilis]